MSDDVSLPEFPIGTMTVTYGTDRKVKVPVFGEEQVREVIKKAAEAERESCARICDERGWHVTAKLIRERGKA